MYVYTREGVSYALSHTEGDGLSPRLRRFVDHGLKATWYAAPGLQLTAHDVCTSSSNANQLRFRRAETGR